MSNATNPAAKSRAFFLRVVSRANEIGGSVDCALTEVLTERGFGFQVDTHVVGVEDGDYTDKRSSKYYPRGEFDDACGYRLSHGYVEIKAVR